MNYGQSSKKQQDQRSDLLTIYQQHSVKSSKLNSNEKTNERKLELINRTLGNLNNNLITTQDQNTQKCF